MLHLNVRLFIKRIDVFKQVKSILYFARVINLVQFYDALFRNKVELIHRHQFLLVLIHENRILGIGMKCCGNIGTNLLAIERLYTLI